MSMTAFRAEHLPAPARLTAWRSALTNFAIVPGITGSPEAFCGRVDNFRSPRGISFSILESGPQRLAPTPGQVDDIYWLSIVLDGESAIEIEGESTELAAGDILYGKRGAAGVLDIRTPFRMLNATIPAEVLARFTLVPLPMQVVRLDGDAGANRVLGALLNGIAASIDRLDDAGAFAIEGALVQLLVNSLFEGTGALPLGGVASARAALLRRIWQSIETRLHDSDLCLADIATEHRLSTRYIQLLFEEYGQSFRSHVRQRRLEKCRADLGNPLNANISITEICLHWGFGDSASFSRAFRDAYDCSPSGFRREALGNRDIKKRLYGLTLASA